MWETMLSGVVTGLVALAGVIWTQKRADQREQQHWDRERAHEKAIWSRDDAARSYEHRRGAYATFLNDFLKDMQYIESAEVESALIPDDALVPLNRRLRAVQIFGTRAAFDLAKQAYERLHDRCFSSSKDQPSWDDVAAAMNAYVDQSRRDLHVSDE